MEAALVSATTGALKPVMKKLAALMGDEYTFLKEVRHEIRFLTDELAGMHVFLLRMSSSGEPDAQDKVWMTAVRELSYDMEDLIDDFMQSVSEKDAKPDGFMEKIKHSMGKLGMLKNKDAKPDGFMEKIKHSMEELGKLKMHRQWQRDQRLEEHIIHVGDMNEWYKVGNQNGSYKSGMATSSINNATVYPRALDFFEHDSKLIGIDEPKAELTKMLIQDGGCISLPQQLKIVSIVGPGGMGKTTLANQVYQELKWQFTCQAFISISHNQNIMNILSTILSAVRKQDYVETEAGSIQHIISEINDILVQTRYFIVVDDIGNVETWDVIKCVFPKKSHGSTIITTTRMSDVADSCRLSFNGHVYNIIPLNMLHSRQLFHRRLFSSKDHCPSYLEDTSNRILKICDGLPLTIIVISGLLASKERTVDIWNQVIDSLGCALEINHSVESMMKILSLSYFDLPPHLKSCLLYLGIYPKDTIIEKECLIMRWVAEGFIYKEGTYTVHELAEMCFNELVNKSLVQMVNEKYHEPNSCRVNDMVLDFIISKAIEDNFFTLAGVPIVPTNVKAKVRRLSLQVGRWGNSIMPTRDLVLSHARPLIVFGNSREIPLLDKFMYLRIMDFGGPGYLFSVNRELKNHHIENIGKLLHLRYLNLGGTGITELPQDIRCLQCLEMLDLRGTMLHVLPKGIVNLGKLVHLYTDCGVTFPEGIVKLQSLEVLQQVSVFKQTFKFMEELGQLMNLRMLCIDFEEHRPMDLWMRCFRFEEDTRYGDTRDTSEWAEPIASCFRGFVSMKNFHYLKIICGGRFLPLGTLCPVPASLRELILFLEDEPFPKVPEWMPSLVNLQELSIDVEGVTHNGLCILGSLPALLKLELVESHYNSEDRILTISGEVGFPYLTKFQYHTRSRGMDLKFAAGSMPKLEMLVFFTGRPYLYSSDTFGFDFGIENLPSLVTLECRVSGDSRCFEAVVKSAASAHPNRVTVHFQKIHL